MKRSRKKMKVLKVQSESKRNAQVQTWILHFAISVFQEVSVNSFPVTPVLTAIQAVTGLSVLVRRPVTGFVTDTFIVLQ